MTEGEFFTDFMRLCKGFRYEATEEQVKAYFKRLAVYHRDAWVEAVDTLLCGPRFPLLDHVLNACETAAESRRRQSVYADNRSARSAEQVMAGRGCPFSQNLFACIKAFSGRQQVRNMIGKVQANLEGLDVKERDRQVKRLKKQEAELNSEYERLLPLLPSQEADEFTVRYGSAVAS